jgi:hypothetical protein
LIRRAWLIALTVALMIVTVPHVLEDFHYGDLLRFGIAPSLAVTILLVAYVVQGAGITLTARAHQAGPWLLAVAGAVWSIGAACVHGHDLLFAGPEYRHGLISKLLEVLIIALGAVIAWQGSRVATTPIYPRRQ